MTHRRRFEYAVFIALALSACGPSVEEDEDVRVFERRRPGCEIFCNTVLDPECGSETPGMYEGVDDCIDYCVSEEAPFWYLQEDESDACGEEFVEFYTCASTSSCEEQWILTNVPARVHETSCVDSSLAHLECQQEHSE